MWPNDWTDTTDEHEMREREQDERDEARGYEVPIEDREVSA